MADNEKDEGHWMEKAFSKHKGSLHRDLGVPVGKKIPAGKLAAAKAGKYGAKDEKKAIPVATAKKINRGKRAKAK